MPALTVLRRARAMQLRLRAGRIRRRTHIRQANAARRCGALDRGTLLGRAADEHARAQMQDRADRQLTLAADLERRAHDLAGPARPRQLDLPAGLYVRLEMRPYRDTGVFCGSGWHLDAAGDPREFRVGLPG